MSDTVDVLESLIVSEGWRLIAERARSEWTTRERTGRKNALNDTDDKRALDKLRQITAAQEAVEWVLELPTQEIARLKRQEADRSGISGASTEVSRARLETLTAIGQMSRRGSL